MESIKEIFRIGKGPSSSHTMGPQRAAQIFLKRHPNAHRFEVTLYGSLPATGKGHMTDVAIQEGGHMSPTATGLIGGALGVLVGVSLMTVRELGRQQKRHEAGQHSSREE